MKKPSTKTVYIITSGTYSDYTIYGVSASHKKAQESINLAKSADAYWASDATIEKWEVDSLLKSKVLSIWGCGILVDDGSIVEKTDDGDNNKRLVEEPFRGRIVQYGVKIPYYNGRKIIRVESSVSQKHAIKIAIEARQKWIRESESESKQK